MPFSRQNKLKALGLLVIFLAFYGALLGGYGDLMQRFGDLKSGAEGRFAVWRLSLPMLFDHALTGIGLESYIKLSPLYLKNASASIIWERAHNEFLEFAIALGGPAMLLFCGCLFSGLHALGRRLKQRRKAILGLAAFAGICGFFIHGLTDFGWHLPVNCVYCVTLLALLAAELDRKSKMVVAS
jgi:O-antigen ligase